VALQRGPGTPEAGAVEDMGAHLLFADPQDIELWAVRLRRGLARLELWEWQKAAAGVEDDAAIRIPKEGRNQLLPLLQRRGKKYFLIDETTEPKNGDQVEWLILSEAAEPAHDRLTERGWRLVEEIGATAGEDS